MLPGMPGRVCGTITLCQQHPRLPGVWPCEAEQGGWTGEPPYTRNGTIFVISTKQNTLYAIPTPQEICLSSSCTAGTYSSILMTAIGDLNPGVDVCIPCDPLCQVCVGPGTGLADCPVCTFAARPMEGCVESCNSTSGEWKPYQTVFMLNQWLCSFVPGPAQFFVACSTYYKHQKSGQGLGTRL